MSFPAEIDFDEDEVFDRNRTACRIYRMLRREQNIFFEPQGIKAWVLAEQLNVRKQTVYEALDLLVLRGYVVECGRDVNKVRQLMLVRDRRARGIPNRTTSAA